MGIAIVARSYQMTHALVSAADFTRGLAPVIPTCRRGLSARVRNTAPVGIMPAGFRRLYGSLIHQ